MSYSFFEILSTDKTNVYVCVDKIQCVHQRKNGGCTIVLLNGYCIETDAYYYDVMEAIKKSNRLSKGVSNNDL